MFTNILLLVLSTGICCLTSALDCNLPSSSDVNQLLLNEITSSGGDQSTATINGGPYYVCQVQGTSKGTYQELSVIMEYTSASIDRVGQFEMICQISPDGWGRRVESLTQLSSGPGASYDSSIGLRTNCSSCVNTAANDNNCVACDSSCNDGLMRCTGSTSDDCCVAFEDDGACKPDLDCTSNNFVANTQNNFTCACGVSCSDGYYFNSTSCTCTLTDICVADNPCNNGGVCILDTVPDQYTCNCTGYFSGTNCSDCSLVCQSGYVAETDCTECVLDDICVADNPCNNGGMCILDTAPDQYTCNCTGYFSGTNCSDCSLVCQSGYVAETDCTECVLTDICVADNPCNNGGVCILDTAPDQYTCNCTGTGYTGTICSDTNSCNLACPTGYQPNTACSECVLTDICVADNPCRNGGNCMLGSSPDQYTCQCVDYYGEKNCSTCTLECLNGGSVNRSCACDCAIGYTGWNCSECDDGYMTSRDDSCVITATTRPFLSTNLWWIILVVVLVIIILIAAMITASIIVYIVFIKPKGKGTKTV